MKGHAYSSFFMSETAMKGGKGTSSSMYVPVQHPNGPTYTTYMSTASVSWSAPQSPDVWQRAENKPAFTLEEIETAKNLITELSDK